MNQRLVRLNHTCHCVFATILTDDAVGILDECTSAVSVDVEENLYRSGVERGVTLVTLSQCVANGSRSVVSMLTALILALLVVI